MKILISNKFYYARGGDCVCTMHLEQLLKQKGHDVAIFAMQHPENLKSKYSKYFPSEVKFEPKIGMVKAFRRPFGTGEVRRKFVQLLNDFKPDIVHLNNIHTQLSPILAKLAHERGIKVIWTIHDYKLLCPRYDCLRNGKNICEECFIDKQKVLQYKCMKDSFIASVLAYKEAKKWNRVVLNNYTDCFICPSSFMGEKMIQGGFSSSKINVLCNFIDINKCGRTKYEKEEYYCYIGRLSHEKGIETLIDAAKCLPYQLVIIGGGPLSDELKDKAKGANIKFAGYMQWDKIKELVGKARFSVVPSEWYENNPMSVIESECLGTPVLGANIGGIPELIEDGKNGMIFESRNLEELKSKIQIMWNTSFDYEKLALSSQDRYGAENYYKEIIKIYQ